LARRFEVLTRQEHIESIKLADYATPYPETPEGERRKVPEKPCDFRNAFIRDRDRIVHSESFRKLQDKTQIFISEKSPIIRNRLTHTLEVWQISVSIARELKANIHLTEAIALAHDLGHTPFGHAGESALDAKMMEKKLEGFSHNEQSVRVVAFLEDPPNIIKPDSKRMDMSNSDAVGLNLTYATREGIFKHTKRFKKCKDKKLYDEFGLSCGTIEAQIVRISDDIAQHTHDLHDIYNAGVIDDEQIVDVSEAHPEFFGYRQFGGTKADISPIIGKLIDDVVDKSLDALNNNYDGDPSKENLIKYSKEGKAFSKEIEHLIEEHAIKGDEVSRMNSRGRHIIKTLFDFCIEDSYCLPLKIKHKFPDDIYKQFNDIKEYKRIDFHNSEDIKVICDYIAGLTDKEAIDIFHSTLI